PCTACCAPTYHLTLFLHSNASSTTDIYTLSLHDALPICFPMSCSRQPRRNSCKSSSDRPSFSPSCTACSARRSECPSVRLGEKRSEEHTSELQSRGHLVCRLLLEKKKNYQKI